MRLFVALDTPEGLKGILARLRTDINPLPSFRVVDPANVHLTLTFLGEVPDGKVGKVVAALHDVPFSGCTLQTTKLGIFPHVLWLGVKLNEELAQLQQHVVRAVRPFTTRDPRPYQPHLTLARFGRLGARERTILDRLVKETRIEERWKSDAFVLYRSMLTPTGPIYEVVERFRISDNIENN